MPIIPGIGRLRQEDHGFKANLGYVARPYLKKKKKMWTLELNVCRLLPYHLLNTVQQLFYIASLRFHANNVPLYIRT
jgi:hypothetical protein